MTEPSRRNPTELAANLIPSAQSTWCWLPKKDPSDPNKTVFERINRMVVAGPNSTTAITNVRVILNNLFAPLPIIGHSYSSAQFIGKGSTEVSLTLADVGGNELSEIQAMADEVQGNARAFRRVKNCNRVKFFGNPLFNLTGVKSGIISGISSSTTDNTDLYNMQISFSADGQHEETFRQEMYIQSNVFWSLLDTIFGWVTYDPRVIQIPQEVASDLRYLDSHRNDNSSSYVQRANRIISYFTRRSSEQGELFQEVTGDQEDSWQDAREANSEQLPDSEDLIYQGSLAVGSVVSSLRQRSTLSTTSNSIASLNAETREAAEANKVRIPNDGVNGSYPIRRPTWSVNQNCPLPAAAERLIPILERHKNRLPIDPFFHGQSSGVLLNRQGDRINSGLISDIPTNVANKSGGTIMTYMSRSQLATEINSYRSDLFVLAREILEEYGATDEFERYFPGLFEDFLASINRTSFPAYPDLDLPPHPVTARTIDVNPDYYFWNDSDESIMNDIGPQLESRLSARTDRLMQSINGLVSHRLFDNTYLDRGILPPGLDSQNSGSLTGTSSAHEVLDETSPLFNYSTNLAANSPNRVSLLTMRTRVLSTSPSVLGSYGPEGEDAQTRERRVNMIWRATNPATPIQPTDDLNVGPVDQQALVNNPEDLNPSVTAAGLINIAKQSFFTNPNDVLSMRRAFPTFKLYFIEEDTGPMREHAFARGMNGKIVAYFDDFFNYNSIKDIRLIRSRKQPADLLVCTLINVSGLLDGRKWSAEGRVNRESWEPGLQETEMENPLKSILLKEGMKIQLKLGYENNPNKLAEKFVGELVEVSFNDESPDLVTIVAQSYGTELVCEKKISDGSTGFESTQHLLHGIMMSPELAHFGRFDLNPNFNPAEVRTRVSSGTGLINGLWDRIDGIRDDLARTRSRWVIHNNPADDNIYAPDVLSYKEWKEKYLGEIGHVADFWASFQERHPGLTGAAVGAISGILPGLSLFINLLPGRWIANLLSPSVYLPTGETIWEIFKEMELRHPGYIGHPRPYGTRMTMFFGLPSQRYWAHQATQEEMIILRTIEQRLETQLNPDGSDIGRSSYARTIEFNAAMFNSDLALLGLTLSDALRTRRPINEQMMKFGNEIGFVMGRYRPFRKFHVITSDHHILLNNIRASEKNTYNAITLTYEGDKTYTMKADDNIQDKDLRMGYFHYPNCISHTFARRYCIGLLMRYLKDVYKGEIVVTGMNIDPYDIVYLFDTYSDMYGPVEVEQVIDTFSRETGWITEITPDMCVFANEYSTMITSDLYNDWLRENFMPIVYSAGAAGVTNIFNPVFGSAAMGGVLLGLIGGYYYIKYTQDRQPILIHPLILNNKPFFSGVDGFRLDGVFANLAGKLMAEVDNLQRGWNAFHFSEYVQDWFLARAQGVAGQGPASSGVQGIAE